MNRCARLLRTITVAALLSLPCLGALAQEVPARDTATSAEEIARTTTRGPVTAVLTLSPATPRIGDVLRLSLVVTAAPEVEVLMPAFGESLGSFTILEYAPKDRIDAEGRTVLEQRYSLDVPMSGEWSIPPLVVEFIDGRPGNAPAPEGEDAYELLTETIEFSVESVLPTDAEAELRPPLGTLEPLPTALDRARPYLWFGAVFLLGIPLVIWILVIGLRGARRRSAYDIALARLRKLQEAPRATPEEIDRFYVELSAIGSRSHCKRRSASAKVNSVNGSTVP